MEKINNIFLNYKTYNAFQRDLNAGKISPNSIAFIQDNLRIWAHDKEYACNGLSIQNTGQGSMKFVDALGNTVLTLSADPNGYVNIAGITGDAYDVFISKGDFANYVEVVEQLKRDFERYKTIVVDPSLFVKKEEMEGILNEYNSRNSKMVTLSASAYQYLVDNDLVDRNTYYFTYEGEDVPEGDTWHFGDPFPIIFTETWEFGGTFPITLS